MNEKKIKIFLVDDHRIVRSGLKFLIEAQKNMTVIGEASEAKMALMKLSELEPDIILMDISMPGLDGIETTLEIKGRFPNIKVLILTMHDDEQLLFKSIKAGGSGYILKNSPAEDLIEAINSIYEGNHFITPHIKDILLADYIERFNNDNSIKDRYETLSKREKEVLSLIARRLTNEKIADKMNITVRTVKAHRSSLILKLQIDSRLELINYAKRKLLIEGTI